MHQCVHCALANTVLVRHVCNYYTWWVQFFNPINFHCRAFCNKPPASWVLVMTTSWPQFKSITPWLASWFPWPKNRVSQVRMWIPTLGCKYLHSGAKWLIWIEKCCYDWLDQNFDPSLLTNKLWRNEGKIIIKNEISRPKKTELFKIANSQYFLVKISGISPWMCRIDWCKGHWCGSTYMVMRLSDISPKTGKKCFFGVFRPFLSLSRRALWPYRLSHINALCINQSY